MTERLLTAANLINCDIFCDVGTDHAYLPSYLLSLGKIKFAYISDINDGPLLTAKKNISRLGCEDKVKFIKSDGFQNYGAVKFDIAAICGMGGEMISDIIFGGMNFVSKAEKIILQPMTKQYKLREFLYNSGFEITSERLALEGKKYYNIIEAKKRNAPLKRKLTEFELNFGFFETLEDNEKYLKGYLEKHLSRQKKIYDGKNGKEDAFYERALIRELEEKIADF